MRIVVTGGAGFIGSNVVDQYVAAGHEVLIIDDLSSGVRENVNAKARLLVADVRSAEAARAIFAFRPELLNVHAAQIDVRRSVTDPKVDAEVNILGFLSCLEAARAGGALSRVVYAASGGSMYGDTQAMPTSEREPIGAVSPYGVSKAAAELYLQAYRAMYGLHYVALRYANIYGPRQNPHGEAGVVSIFCERILSGKGCTIYGDGGQTRDFVHVHDVAAANLRAVDTPFCGGVNLGTGVETDINRVYHLICKAAGVKANPSYGPARAGEQRRSVLDGARAKTELDWQAKLGIEAGLENTVAWYRSRAR